MDKNSDGCKFCLGFKGGVPGNANVIGGEVICDYCTSLLIKVRDAEITNPTSSLFAVAGPPADVQPALTVWYGSMPESNGKSNFMALLKRKGAGLFDTNYMTIAMSEYPERVRYEADCVRYLIGELKEEPSILDYDTDKHSGYVENRAGQ